MSKYALKNMGKRVDKLDAEFRKGPKYPYLPTLSFAHAYAKSGFWDIGKMERESRR